MQTAASGNIIIGWVKELPRGDDTINAAVARGDSQFILYFGDPLMLNNDPLNRAGILVHETYHRAFNQGLGGSSGDYPTAVMLNEDIAAFAQQTAKDHPDIAAMMAENYRLFSEEIDRINRGIN